MKRSILIITTTDFSRSPVGGRHESEEIARGLQANGYSCRIISADMLPPPVYTKERIFRFFCRRVKKSLFRSYLSLGKAVSDYALSLARPDIILSRDIFCSLHLAGKRIPVIQDVTSRISDSKYETGRITKNEYHKMQLLEQEVYAKASLIIAKDRRLKDYLGDYVDHRKIHVLYPPIPDYFRPKNNKNSLKDLFGLGVGGKIILFNPTRIVAQKGFAIVERLTQSLRQYRFLVTFRTGGMNRFNTTATGVLSREILPDIYSAADLVLVPSLKLGAHTEGISQIALEAMLCCTPVIASDVGGLREHKNYLILTQPTHAAFLGAIKNFFRREKDLSRLESARRYAARFYSSVYIKRYINLIERLF